MRIFWWAASAAFLVGCAADDRGKGLAGAQSDGGLVESGGSSNGGATGSGGSGTTVGNGGAEVGNGGTTVGSGGATVGNGGATVGNGGATVGNGGATVGNGGATVGNGGTTVGDGGSNGTGGAFESSGGSGGEPPGNGGTGGTVTSDAGPDSDGGVEGMPDAGSGHDDSGTVVDAGVHADSGIPEVVLPTFTCTPPAETACGYPSLGTAAADDWGAGVAWGWVSDLDRELGVLIPTLDNYAAAVRAGSPPACLVGRSWYRDGTVTADVTGCSGGIRGLFTRTVVNPTEEFTLDLVVPIGGFVFRIQGALSATFLAPAKITAGSAGLTVTDPEDPSNGVHFSSLELKHDSGISPGPPTSPPIHYDLPSAKFSLVDATSCKSLEGQYGFTSSTFGITVTDGTTSGRVSAPIQYTPTPHVNVTDPGRSPACVRCSDASTVLSSVSCGTGGHERRLCADGWVQTLDDCVEPVGCEAGSTKPLRFTCGMNHRGRVTATCVNGAFAETSCADPDVCVDGATRAGSTACGNGSSYFQICVSGQWVDTGVCLEDCGTVGPGTTAGSVQVTSDADLAALAGVNQIAGNLTFVSYTPAVADWAASVRCVTGNVEIAGGTYADLSGLRNLRSVGGMFRVDTDVASGDLTGLDALRFVGGALTVSGSSVNAVSGMPMLTRVGAIELTDSAVTSLAPLSAVSGVESLTVSRSALTQIPEALGFLPSVTTVWLDANQALSDVSGLATLERACVSIYDSPGLTEVPLSSLKTADCLTVWNSNALSSITMPSLEAMPGSLELVGLPALRTLDVGTLAGYVRSIQLEAVGLMDLSGFATAQFSIAGDLSIRECADLKSLSGLSGLERIGLGLTITDNPVLRDVSALASTSSVGGFIEIGNSPLLATCSVRALLDGWPLRPDVLPVSIYGMDDFATCP